MYGFNNFHFFFLSFSFERFFIMIKTYFKIRFRKIRQYILYVFFSFICFFFWKSIGEPMIILLLKLTYFMFMNKYHKIHIIFSFNIFLKLWNYIFPPLKWPMDSAQLKVAFKILPKSPPFKINKYFVVTCIFLFFSLLFKKIWCPFFTAIP